jgi:hypothetical protein
MSLRAQFPADLVNVFHNTDEFATTREFRLSDGHGAFTLKNIDVVWDEEEARRHPVVTIHGIIDAAVICYIQHKDLSRPPLAGEIIYSPANKPWEIGAVTDEESEWKLALVMTRSQTGYYNVS